MSTELTLQYIMYATHVIFKIFKKRSIQKFKKVPAGGILSAGGGILSASGWDSKCPGHLE